jgi:hypothetical protein
LFDLNFQTFHQLPEITVGPGVFQDEQDGEPQTKPVHVVSSDGTGMTAAWTGRQMADNEFVFVDESRLLSNCILPFRLIGANFKVAPF